MYGKLDASSKDVVAMNLTIAALHRWLSNLENCTSGERIGREIGAMYSEIHGVVDELFADDDGEEDEEEEDDDDRVGIVPRIAV
jgi:hypothetical protein